MQLNSDNCFKSVVNYITWSFQVSYQYSLGLSGRFGLYLGNATSTAGDLKREFRELHHCFRVLDQCAPGKAKQLGDEALLAEATTLVVMPDLEGAAPGWGASRMNPNRMSTGSIGGEGGSSGVNVKQEVKVKLESDSGLEAGPCPRIMLQITVADTAAEATPAGSRTVHNRPLTSEEEAIADEYLVDELHDPNQVINDMPDFGPVSREKIRCLEPTEWLNDAVINFFMGLLKARGDAATEADGLPRCHFFSTSFYCKLYGDHSTFTYAAVKRWTRKIDVFANDLLICPIHCHGNHWTLAVVNFRDKRFEYFDSLGGGDGGVLKILRRYIESEHLTKKGASWDDVGWTDHVWTAGVHTPLQPEENGWDCGVFCCKTADYLAQGARLDFSEVCLLTSRA